MLIKPNHRQVVALWMLAIITLSPTAFPLSCLAERIAPQMESGNDNTDKGYMMLQVAQPTTDEATPTLKGNVSVEKEFKPDVVFDQSSGETLPTGEKIILTVMDLVATGYSEQGDEFNARVKMDVQRNGKVLIPRGALVKGHVIRTEDPGKAFSKRGKIVLTFDYILMPDGRKIAFKSDYTKGDNTLAAVGRAVGEGAVGTVGGAVNGVLMGLQFGGVVAAVVTHGLTLMVGGGLGAVAGLGSGLDREGDQVMLNEGDTIKVALNEPLQLPEVKVLPDSVNAIEAPGLNVQVTDYTLGRDPFKVENQINLKLNIDNQTDYEFGSFDLALLDEYNNVYSPSPFGQDNLLAFHIAPKSQLSGVVTFSVKSPDVRHYLVFYKPYTRDILEKIPLSEIIKELSSKPHGRHHVSS
jgi:hypothetical protein